MAKKNWLKENIFNLVFLILILGIFGYIYFNGGNLQNVFNINLNQDDLDNLDLNPTGLSCKINMPSSACVGEDVTSIITDGKNGLCRVAYKYEGGDWNFYGDVNTDSSGSATLTDSAEYSGTYTFGAYCIDENGKVCRTNDEIIEINSCGFSEPCTDSDGGVNLIQAGHVTAFEDDKQFYDKCVDSDSVTEYWCDDTGESVVRGENFDCGAGYECLETRSGGMCVESSGYGEGDIIVSESDDGTMGNGINSLINPIEMGNFEEGDCSLGVKISAYWNYLEESACVNLQGFETLAWYFYDSNTGIALDVPRGQQTSFDFCPKYYDGQTDWKIELTKLMSMYSCEIDYDYTVEVYACECQ